MPLLELVGGPEDGLRVSMDELPTTYFRVPVHALKGSYDPTKPVVKPSLGLYKKRGDEADSDGWVLFDWDGVL